MKKINFLHIFYSDKLLYILLAFAIFAIFFVSFNRHFNVDEIESIHTAWKILNGERIYLDFFQHHNPLFYYLLIPFLYLFGETTTTILILRVFIFFSILLILVATYIISKMLFNKRVAIVSLLLLTTAIIFVDKAIEIRPDVPQALFGLLALLFLFSYFEKKFFLSLFLSALFLALSFLFLQKIIFLIIIIFGILIFQWKKGKIDYRSFSTYTLVFFGILSFFFFYLLSKDLFKQYLLMNWVVNIQFNDRSSALQTIVGTLLENTFLWFFYILGLWFLLKTTFQKFLGVITIGFLLPSFFIPSPSYQYFMPMIPLVAMIAANFFIYIIDGEKRILTVLLIVTVVFPLLILLFLPLRNGNYGQIKKINYVLSQTSSKDYVYDGKNQFNVFRKDLDFFWFSLDSKGALTTYQTITTYHYNIYELIEKIKPKVISNNFIDLNEEGIANHYQQSDQYSDIYLIKGF